MLFNVLTMVDERLYVAVIIETLIRGVPIFINLKKPIEKRQTSHYLQKENLKYCK